METTELLTKTFRIDGMTCAHCQNLIEKSLKSAAGVEDAVVNYKTGTATVTYDNTLITFDEIKALIEQLDYKVSDGQGESQLPQIAGTLIIIIALYMLFRMFSTSSLAAAFPVVQTGMGYGMVLIIGLLTSVHCIAMCGGINLSQTLNREWGGGGTAVASENANAKINIALLMPSVLYNSGRVISYTLVGVIVGALGSVLTVSGRFQGAVMLIAGIFMLVMGVNMLGLFPALRRFIPRMPAIFTRKPDNHKASRGPLAIGLLNGLMPCGPLQAMQIYALSTGSPIRGGVSMFLFSMGTVPLMFALGTASGILSGAKGKAFSHKVMRAGAVLVAAMGLTMFSNGWNLTGFDSPVNRITAAFNSSGTRNGAFTPVIQDGVQIVNSTLLSNRYPAIVVQQGIPVRWIINAPQGSINGCNNRFIIREYGIEHTLKSGENVIEFMPEKIGKFSYSCWMGMIRSSITVIAKGENIADVPDPVTAPAPAGVNIPTGEIALARITDDYYQTVEIRLTDDGFEPSIAVMQRQLPALWNISVDSLDPGNNTLIFPAYYTVLDIDKGNNPIRILPTGDFEFSTGDNVFYGYVKVVDDINDVDIETIKAEVANYETLIYPAAYFDTGGGGGGCACCR